MKHSHYKMLTLQHIWEQQQLLNHRGLTYILDMTVIYSFNKLCILWPRSVLLLIFEEVHEVLYSLCPLFRMMVIHIPWMLIVVYKQVAACVPCQVWMYVWGIQVAALQTHLQTSDKRNQNPKEGAKGTDILSIRVGQSLLTETIISRK